MNIIVTFNISSQFDHLGDIFSQRKTLEALHKILRKTDLAPIPKFERDLLSQNDILISQNEILYRIAKLTLQEKDFEYSIAAFKYLLDRINESESISNLYQGKLLISPIKLYREYIEALLNFTEYEKALELCEYVLNTSPNDVNEIFFKNGVYCENAPI
jgi:tetratricopeptide (TPR) repeat protein